jgi:hypothetical protein
MRTICSSVNRLLRIRLSGAAGEASSHVSRAPKFDKQVRGHRVSRAAFEENLTTKLADASFRADMTPLLRPGVPWDFDQAGAIVMTKLLARLP